MRYEKLILFLSIIAVFLCVSHAKERKFSIQATLHDLGISDEDTLLNILDDKNEVKEINKLMPFINKCFYGKEFFTNSKDNIYNVDILTIVTIFYVSLFS